MQAFAILPIMVCIGAGVDYSLANSCHKKLNSVTDMTLQAVLTAGDTASVETRRKAAEQAFRSYLQVYRITGEVSAPTIEISQNKSHVAATVTATSPHRLIFGQILHLPVMNVRAVSAGALDIAADFKTKIDCHINPAAVKAKGIDSSAINTARNSVS